VFILGSSESLKDIQLDLGDRNQYLSQTVDLCPVPEITGNLLPSNIAEVEGEGYFPDGLRRVFPSTQEPSTISRYGRIGIPRSLR
jgi:hypothetical protein